MIWRVILIWLLVANAATTDVRGNTTSSTRQFQLDPANRVICTTTPLGRSNLVVFNHQGLPTLLIDSAAQQTTNTFDGRGRLVTCGDKAGVTTNFYDANNDLLAVMSTGTSNVWTYDAYNRVSSYTDTAGNLIQYRYDANGNCTNLIYPGGRTVAYAYDSLNRVTNITDWAGRQTSLAYDLDGHLTTITRPNGTFRTVSYDAAGQVTNIWEQMPNALPIAWFRLNWTNSGNMAWEFAAPLPHTNSPPTRTMTYDNDNRLLTVNGTGTTNDLNGNLLYGPLPIGSSTIGYFTNHSYDARNRLLNAGGVTNFYDPLNNRIAQTSGTNATIFVVNPNAKLPQMLMRIKNGVTNYYIYGAGLLYQVTETAAGASTLTYHYDYRGSTIALSGDNGLVTDRIEYSLYGSTTYRAGTSDTPFLFNGRYGVQTDPNGLLCMQARYYNPYICRFTTPDPSGFAGGLNLYAYANGNPVSYLDPLGLGAQATGDSDNGGLISFSSSMSADGVYTSNNGDSAVQPAQSSSSIIAGVALTIIPIVVAPEAGIAAELGEAGAIDEAADTGALKFSQTTASPWFSEGSTFENSTISDVASQLRSGALTPADVPIQTVTIDGNTLIVNTRSSLALSQAGIPQSEWTLVDASGDQSVVNSIVTRLANNGLTSAGTPVIRITGSGSGASTYIGSGSIPKPY